MRGNYTTIILRIAYCTVSKLIPTTSSLSHLCDKLRLYLLPVYPVLSIPTPPFSANSFFAIFFLTLRTSISSARISVTTPAICGTRSRAPWLKLRCAFRSAGGTRIPNQVRGSRGVEGVEGSAVDSGLAAEALEEGSEEGSEEEGCSGGGGRDVGDFAPGVGRRENIGKEDGEGFMHLVEWA